MESYRQAASSSPDASLGRKGCCSSISSPELTVRREAGPARGRPPRGGGAPGLGLVSLVRLARTRPRTDPRTRAAGLERGVGRTGAGPNRRGARQRARLGRLAGDQAVTGTRQWRPEWRDEAERRERHAQGAGRLPPAATLGDQLLVPKPTIEKDVSRKVALRPHLPPTSHGPARRATATAATEPRQPSPGRAGHGMAGRSPITCSQRATPRRAFGIGRSGTALRASAGLRRLDHHARQPGPAAVDQGSSPRPTGGSPEMAGTSPALPGRGTNARSHQWRGSAQAGVNGGAK